MIDEILIGWVIIFIVMVIYEAVTAQIVSIWFAVGSFVCIFLAYFEVNIVIQLVVFVVVSTITLYLVRPIMMKRMQNKITPTNADELIGRKAVVCENFDSNTFTGRVKIDSLDWLSKSIDKEALKEGDIVVIKKIEGATLQVIKENVDGN